MGGRDGRRCREESSAHGPPRGWRTGPGQDRSEAALDDHLRRQVLDVLNALYPFPIAPPLVERELAAIRQTAGAGLDVDFSSLEERRSWDKELR
jgi:hypothetical protein